MTYHPRFAAGDLQSASRQLPIVQLLPHLQRAHDEPSIQWMSSARSANRELSIAHAHLARLFPDENFAPGCIAWDRRTAIGLLTGVIGLLVVIAIRGIS